MKINIRKADLTDIPQIMTVMESARRFMRSEGNLNQWTGGYPGEEILRRDIELGWSYVVTTGRSIIASFCLMPSPEPSYASVYGGRGWIDDVSPYIVLHRVASDGSVRGMFRRAVEFAACQCGNLRVDTHVDNARMLAAIRREGFLHCGTVRLPDGSEREAFQRIGPGVEEWKNRLLGVARSGKIPDLMRFFKTGPGEYGEGDRFIGVTVPDNRRISRQYAGLGFDEIASMLESDIHEFRLGALLALVEKYRCATTQAEKDRIVDFYIENGHKANNWDLVDLSCEYILGPELSRGRRLDELESLMRSGNLWRERIAVVSMLCPIRGSQLDLPFDVAKRMLSHPHDLIRKAVGWILREAGKKDSEALRGFLRDNAGGMSSITLGYAVELFTPEERAEWRSYRRRTIAAGKKGFTGVIF